jgi:hypothetical protein
MGAVGALTMENDIMETNHLHEDVPGGVPLKMWTRGVRWKTRPSAS